ncbi:MAG: hypothetical protein QXH27_03990 [Candidatus Micrarchaeia archaeon]
MLAQPGLKRREFKPGQTPADAFADRMDDFRAPEVKAEKIKAEEAKPAPEFKAPEIKPASPKPVEFKAPEIRVEPILHAPEINAEAPKPMGAPDVFASKLVIEEVGVLREVLKADAKRLEVVRKESKKLEERAHADFEKSVAEERKRLARPAEPPKKIIHASKAKRDRRHKTGPDAEDPSKENKDKA